MISVSIIKLNEVKPARTSMPLPPAPSLFSSWLQQPSLFILALVSRRMLITVMQFLAALLFAGSQIVFFLASEPLCNVSCLAPARDNKLINRHRKGKLIVPS